jgi:hypothetical protein
MSLLPAVLAVEFPASIRGWLCGVVFLAAPAWLGANPQWGLAEEPPAKATPRIEELDAIGGNWFKSRAERSVYYYRDGERLLDLFSYHIQDSNRDGIENLQISHDDRFLIIRSQGYPNHPTALFPNSQNPNAIRVQDFTFRLPLRPQMATEVTRVPMGPIGMALNGVVFFNPFEMQGMNAVEGYSEVWLDACCGHPQQTGVYHYHKYPTCVKSPFHDNGKQHSPILGFAWDGFPIHGPYEADGELAKDLQADRALDVCNGHRDAVRGYHYHVTPGRFPYIMGGYAGVVELSNNRALQRVEKGPIENTTIAGEGRLSPVIAAVRPGIVTRGKKHSIQIELQPDSDRRQALPEAAPSWIQIGPYEATAIKRDENLVTVELMIPQDAPVGVWFDCHVEFAGLLRRTLVYKKNDALRVSP